MSRWVVGAAVLVGVLLAVTSRPAPRPAAMPMQCRQLYNDVVESEAQERQEAARRFRGSPWSQDDDFHFKEAKRVKDFSKHRSVSITSLLDALDEGIHQHWPTPSNRPPNPKVMPCRPRLTY